ncbi:hypothetical protein MKW92_035513 [Papaver armeniacum]|nr:hypothetical protein MKW92_035513 [Papaver armeniacum]
MVVMGIHQQEVIHVHLDMLHLMQHGPHMGGGGMGGMLAGGAAAAAAIYELIAYHMETVVSDIMGSWRMGCLARWKAWHVWWKGEEVEVMLLYLLVPAQLLFP